MRRVQVRGRLIRLNSPLPSLPCRARLTASTWILMPESAGGIIRGLYLHFPCGTQMSSRTHTADGWRSMLSFLSIEGSNKYSRSSKYS